VWQCDENYRRTESFWQAGHCRRLWIDSTLLKRRRLRRLNGTPFAPMDTGLYNGWWPYVVDLRRQKQVGAGALNPSFPLRVQYLPRACFFVEERLLLFRRIRKDLPPTEQTMRGRITQPLWNLPTNKYLRSLVVFKINFLYLLYNTHRLV